MNSEEFNIVTENARLQQEVKSLNEKVSEKD